MIESINMLEIFIETHNEVMTKNKKKYKGIRIHTIQNIYLELLTFIHNSSYW